MARGILSIEGGNPDPEGDQGPERGLDHTHTERGNIMRTGPGHPTGRHLNLWASMLMMTNRGRKKLLWLEIHSSPGNVILLVVNSGVLICGTIVAKGVLKILANTVLNVLGNLCQLMVKQGYLHLYLNMFLLLQFRMQVLLMALLLHILHMGDLHK